MTRILRLATGLIAVIFLEQNLLSNDHLLTAIREVETGNDSTAIGKLGERGAYQFRQQTWKQHTKKNFIYAHNNEIASNVASLHLAWLTDNFQRRTGRAVTDRDLYVMWRMGLEGYGRSGFKFTNVPKHVQDSAQRVQNLTYLAASKN